MTSNVYLRVEQAMTSDERERFLSNFVALNPRWQGAHVADVLDALSNQDSHLEIVEPLYEARGGEVPEPGLLGACARAVAVVEGSAPHGRRPGFGLAVFDLIERVRALGG